jgi:hypothetical protein
MDGRRTCPRPSTLAAGWTRRLDASTGPADRTRRPDPPTGRTELPGTSGLSVDLNSSVDSPLEGRFGGASQPDLCDPFRYLGGAPAAAGRSRGRSATQGGAVEGSGDSSTRPLTTACRSSPDMPRHRPCSTEPARASSRSPFGGRSVTDSWAECTLSPASSSARSRRPKRRSARWAADRYGASCRGVGRLPRGGFMS